MKPRLFIGSSFEGLGIANAIQENLDYDCNATVWTQGVFNLSSNSLVDLLATLDNSDFGVFVFTPDDVTSIRNNSLNTVRDNVIFELGLFIGRLGKDRVFFVIPREVQNFHLPTDLIGITPGKYNNMRDDSNLLAALGPFCNQIRDRLKKFTYENLLGFESETPLAKKIAIEKPDNWEVKLTSELLKPRLDIINRDFLELEKGFIYKRTNHLDFVNALALIETSNIDISRLATMFQKVLSQEFKEAYGTKGAQGNIYDIKRAVEKLDSICKELLAWEMEIRNVVVPNELKQILELMTGWTKGFIDEINKLPVLIDNSLSKIQSDSDIVKITLDLGTLPNVEEIKNLLKTLHKNNK